jgi:alkanesulfonate monooxygenase SsuD/methylene tetrahydromethanopterin reductase-like flavin-dependent oxidoreductase (luciferase family)
MPASAVPNPVKLAEDVAVLDNISGGRVTLGVAPGYVTEEFAGMGVSYANRASRFEEYLDVLQAAWTNETFSADALVPPGGRGDPLPHHRRVP